MTVSAGSPAGAGPTPSDPPGPIPPFRYQALPMRVRFGAGELAALGEEIDELGLSRVLVLSTPEQAGLAHRVAELLGDRVVGVHPHAVMHVPVDVADAATTAALDAGADGCVAVGGGSTVGLGKAIALRAGLPVVAVPTTYAGSEMTPVWGLTEGGAKRTGRDPAVLPRSVVYDPELTLSLPRALTVTSAFNALAHAVEALYAPDASPIISLMAEESARALTAGLAGLRTDDPGVRSRLLYGAWLAGACLGATTMGLHHKLCHALGGSLDLPHAETHTVLLPHVLAFNAPAAPAAVRALNRAMGHDHPATALRDLARALGAPTSLAELGVAREQLPPIAHQAVTGLYSNPRRVSEPDVAALLDRAHDGVLA